jgi:hypothetical protein
MDTKANGNGRPAYTLPGVMHYLQTEWATNHRDRILMQSELEELKVRVAKLTSENNSLRQTNLNLQKELGHLRADGNAAAGVDTGIDKLADELKQVNISPLVQARQHLENRMKEVVFLLKGTDSDLQSQLELDCKRALLAVRESHKTTVAARSEPKNAFATPSPESSGAGTDIMISSSSHDLYEGVETDNETVMGEDENYIAEPPQHPTNPQTPNSNIVTNDAKTTSSEVSTIFPNFTLSPHISRIRSLSVLSDSLLSLSSEGSIFRWHLPACLGNARDNNHLCVYQCSDNPHSIRWITKEYFTTISDKYVTFWSISGNTVGRYDLVSPVDQLDVNSKSIVLKSGNDIKILSVKIGDSLKWKEQTLSIPQNCEAIALQDSHLFVKTEDGIDIHDLSEVNTNLKAISIKGLEIQNPIIRMHVSDELLAFVTKKEGVIFDPNDKRVILKVADLELNDLIVTKNNYLLINNNGTGQVFDLRGRLKSKLDHYSGLLESHIDESSNSEKGLSDSNLTVGTTYQDKYILTGGEDGTIHGYEV